MISYVETGRGQLGFDPMSLMALAPALPGVVDSITGKSAGSQVAAFEQAQAAQDAATARARTSTFLAVGAGILGMGLIAALLLRRKT